MKTPPCPSWLCVFGLALWLLAGCGGDSEEPGVDESSGDEEGTGIAKAMPVDPNAAPEQTGVPAISDEPTILHPSLEAIPGVGAAGPPPPPKPGTASPWGAPDAESGAALPKRKPMKKAAVASFKHGLAAAAAGNLSAAKTSLEKASQADPKSYEVMLALGVVADRAGQPSQALAYYRKSLSLQPDYERAADAVVKLYLLKGDARAAVSFIEPIATKWTRNLSLQAVYAEALIAADRLDDADRVTRAALRRDERFVPAMVELARSSIERGRFELADSILAQALVIDPNYPEVHFLQGQAAEREGHITVAMNSFKKAAELRPEYAEARTALGIQYMGAGNYAAALAEFEAAARLAPMMPQAHLNLGDAYRVNKRWQDAKREFDVALRMNSSLPQAHFDLGLMYMSAGADFPGMQLLDALQKATSEFNTYRSQMGPKLKSDDPSEGYMADLARQIEREKKRIEREKRKAQQASSEG